MKNEFADLIYQNQDLIHKVCRLYCHDAEDRRDLFQDIVYQLWKSYGSFRAEAKFTTWMYRVALNTAITRFKKEKRGLHTQDITDRSIQVSDAPPDTEAEERLQYLYEAIAQLGKVERAIIMLHLEEHSYQEIALIVGITENHVGVKINRIKKKLKTLLSKKEISWN